VRDERILDRARLGADASQAGVVVAERISQAFTPWPSARSLDTTATLADQVDEVASLIEAG
jgi:hypothetical protein